MNRILSAIFYLIFSTFGGLVGYNVASYTQSAYSGLTDVGKTVNFVALIITGMLIGAVIAPIFTRWLIATIEDMAVRIKSISFQEFILGIIGLLLGLVLAFLFNIVFFLLDFSSIPIVGPYLAPFIILTTTVIFAYLGAYLASRSVIVENLRDLLSGYGFNTTSNKYILDTSVIIDGRLFEVLSTGFLTGTFIIPRFVLDELQELADSANDLEREKGRKGLEDLNRAKERFPFTVEDKTYNTISEVDSKLVKMAQETNSSLITNDSNLQKVAAFQGVNVLNINSLAFALKSIVVPGDEVEIKLIRPGKERAQALGYLNDGTMIVVQDAYPYIGSLARVQISSIIQSPNGKILFGDLLTIDGQPPEEPSDISEESEKKPSKKKKKRS